MGKRTMNKNTQKPGEPDDNLFNQRSSVSRKEKYEKIKAEYQKEND